MANDEITKSKYECLREATKEAGLSDLLPPVKAGTDITEGPAYKSNNIPIEIPDSVKFSYETQDGRKLNITAGEYREGWQAFIIGENYKRPFGGMGIGEPMAFGMQNVETGKVRNYPHPREGDRANLPSDYNDTRDAKEGTVLETANKIKKCRDRDPPMS